MTGYDSWSSNNSEVLKVACSPDGDNSPFDFGIFKQALSSDIVLSTKFVSKYCYYWAAKFEGLETNTYPGETIFSIALAISGLILFALLIGKMQWLHHRLPPDDLQERFRRYDQCKWLETHGMDEENLVQTLPKDLRRDIKRHSFLSCVFMFYVFVWYLGSMFNLDVVQCIYLSCLHLSSKSIIPKRIDSSTKLDCIVQLGY
ncbi:Cyclic nucleotide-binding-like protein [Cynara cardunculus var. scolymus]|uniref:Cyclic nucleotide-binding-like protein n=1 Tax=Cynara cardunculus var. scolymus TaxID=59895 RepID=A0A124SI84_CYNCS|nr:Cyclic nucleotide-binding-like protein [Cynara cardunculus var. scolymus]